MLTIVRLIFLVVVTLIGFIIAGPAGAGGGLLTGLVVLAIELGLGRSSGRAIRAAAGGLIVGLIAGTAVGYVVSQAPGPGSNRFAVFGGCYLVFGYLGVLVAVRKRGELLSTAPGLGTSGAGEVADKLLDTSAIIDGRVADVAETRFLEGRVIIPRFVLRELQLIADSSDPLKRARGRRGLEILKRLQQGDNVAVEIEDVDVQGVRDVDAKLVKLAKDRGARVVTTDFNLNRVADLEGIAVLNLNDLSNALKPVVLPGESLSVQIMKRGKELDQGVGYLDDGTMVVVEKAAGLIGQELTVMTTSVLQTAAGRMIFAEIRT